HADVSGTTAACHASLERLGTDRLDLYLLHWRGGVPLAETVTAMENLAAAGDILSWGVSNLDPSDLDELDDAGGAHSASGPQVDQVLYNLTRRGPELDLFGACERRGLRVMAYSPIEQGRVLGNAVLESVAADLGATTAQVALAWVLRRDDVIAIPKASSRVHVEQNAEAARLHLPENALAALDREFPAPAQPVPLEMI
ncbi:MAG: aldo/keto reductase, partial [Cellulomonadaceae bacterium]